MLQDSIITEDELSSAAAEPETEPEPQKEPTIDKNITESTVSSDSGNRRSSRKCKPVERFDPSLAFRVLRTPRTRTTKSIVKSLRAAVSDFWAERLQPAF